MKSIWIVIKTSRKTYEFNRGLWTNYSSENKIFVMGDNRLISKDSRNGLGFIDREDVLGKLAGIYYPFEHMKIIK